MVAFTACAPDAVPCGSDPATTNKIDAVRTAAETSCEARGSDCESGRYVSCVNAEIAVSVKRGDLPRSCRPRAEVSEARCRQLLRPDSGYVK
jgi:hypothetical protein